jgi:hypothetical protein
MRKLAVALVLSLTLASCVPQRAAGPVLPPPSAEKCSGSEGYAQSFSGRRTFTWRPAFLERIRTEAGAQALRDRILAGAEQALVGAAPTVTAKWGIPPSGDRHDYLSWPGYWWEVGLNEYETRDGTVNPESKSRKFDVSALREMQRRVTVLSLGAFLNGDPRYARKAAELLATWFVDPGTAMNPNLDFSQAVPGRRGATTIDSTRLIAVVESIGLLEGSGALSPEIQAGLRRWFSLYIDWMTGSRAPGDRYAVNNWGLSYDLQLAEFALFAGRIDVAREVMRRVSHERLARQIALDGRLPAETARTHGLSYSLFALGLMFQLADLGACLDVDLWSSREGGAGIRTALDFLIPFVGHEDTWPYRESKDPEAIQRIRQGFRRLLLKAGWAYREPRYFADAAALDADGAAGWDWPVPLPDYLN